MTRIPVVVPATAPCIGKSLIELRWREMIGVNIVMIKRGDLHIPAPDKDQRIFPYDELLVLGTDHQIQRLKVLIRPEQDPRFYETEDVELYNFKVTHGSPLIGRTIRNTGLREKANALVVGIENNSQRILNPESDLSLKENDVLFIVGNKSRVKTLLRNLDTREDTLEITVPRDKVS